MMARLSGRLCSQELRYGCVRGSPGILPVYECANVYTLHYGLSSLLGRFLDLEATGADAYLVCARFHGNYRKKCSRWVVDRGLAVFESRLPFG